MECVTCVSVWLGVGYVGSELVTGLGVALPILEEHGGNGGLCFGYGSVGGVGESGCAAWAREAGVMSVCVVSLDSLC